MRPKERQMNEVVRNRIRVPPNADRNERHGRHGQQQRTMTDGERDEQRVARRVTQNARRHLVTQAAVGMFLPLSCSSITDALVFPSGSFFTMPMLVV